MISTMCSKDSDPTGPDDSQGLTVKTVTFSGWDRSYEITNAETKVIVVPAIGRIMYYGLKDGNNILWNNSRFFGKTLPPGEPYRENGKLTWANFGGDKVWPTEQSKFPDINGHAWPPDHWFDGGVHEAEELPNGVKITSRVSDYCGARSIREITLAEKGTELSIRQTIRKEKRARVNSVELIEYTIWNVTQIRNPYLTLFNLNPASTLPNGMYFWSNEASSNFTRHGDVGVLVPSASASQKAGADSDYWLAAIVDNTVIGEFFRLQPGATYPDGGLSAEVYTSPEYTELELLSPLQELRLEEEIQFDISWRLHKLSKNAVTRDQKREAAVEWLNSFAE